MVVVVVVKETHFGSEASSFSWEAPETRCASSSDLRSSAMGFTMFSLGGASSASSSAIVLEERESVCANVK